MTLQYRELKIITEITGNRIIITPTRILKGQMSKE